MAHKYDVFVSYKSDDADWVQSLAKNLTACGKRVFLDSWELVPGEKFTQADLARKLSDTQYTRDEIERSLERLELAFILGREGGSYSFRVPLFRKIELEGEA